MIGKLTGQVGHIETDHIIMDVNGVGYVVYASPATITEAAAAGTTSLLIDTVVREDRIQLFGFMSAEEQRWFRLLTSVQGVGPKAAFSILSVAPVQQLMLAIASQDKAVITRADGVGPKLAARILTELKDKAGDIALKGNAAPTSAAPAVEGTAAQDAVSALVNLGYGRSEAFAAIQKVQAANDDDQSVEALITLALKELA